MKTDLEQLSETKVKLTVEVPYDEMKPRLETAYKEIGEQVKIPGFRPGHVPARIIDQRIGRGYVIEQAINAGLSEWYSAAIAEKELSPMAPPEVDVTETPNIEGENGGQLVFTAETEVMPSFDLPKPEDIEIQVDNIEVTDDDVETELDQLRERFASLHSVDRAAAEGDYTSIDMSASIDGEEIDSVSGVSYEVGSNSMLEGMDEALTGMKADEEKDFTSTLKGGEHAGETADVHIKLRSVKERELPEADDDFAQLVSEFDSIGELRSDLREQAGKSKRSQQAVQARDRLVEYYIEHTDFPVPEGVLEKELQAREEAGLERSDELAESVTKSLRETMLMNRIADEVKPEVGQQELLEYVFQMSQAYGIDAGQILSDRDQISMIVADMTRNKAVVALLRQIRVVDADGAEVDLSEFTKDPAEAAAEAAAAATDEEHAEGE